MPDEIKGPLISIESGTAISNRLIRSQRSSSGTDSHCCVRAGSGVSRHTELPLMKWDVLQQDGAKWLCV